MEYKTEFLHCDQTLRDSSSAELEEIFSIIRSIPWARDFSYTRNDKDAEHQIAYNLAFKDSFKERGWETQPKLGDTGLTGDFRKELVFVEIQFGTSPTLCRDFYKFQYGFQHGLLSLAVSIVPTKPVQFFPTRPRSISGMAEYDLALKYFTLIPIEIPTLIIGLKPN